MKEINKMIKHSLNIPINICYWWNIGSLFGIFLLIQIISGLLLFIHYCLNISIAFDKIIHIILNVSDELYMMFMWTEPHFFLFVYIYMLDVMLLQFF